MLISSVVAKGSWPPPPHWTEKPRMARYLAHYAVWGTVSAISPRYGFIPYGTLQSFSDGPLDKSTGIPYFYMANVSVTYANIAYNNSVSFSLSQAEGPYCQQEQWDPETPLCARMTMAGKIVKVIKQEERTFAQKALFSRHPVMKDWPKTHGWDFYKLDLAGIALVDYFGGAAEIKLKDYYAAKP